MKKRDFETHQKRFRDFEILPKFSEIPVFRGTIRLLHYSGRFASTAEYLFFAQFIIEQKKISEQINIALKKVCGQRVTASQLK